MHEGFRSGIFIAPFHVALEDDATLAIRRDLELVQLCETLGFNEAWVGEHHSGGTEIIHSPELFLAAAAELTQSIVLGTGVISLPYHNPLMVANRILQLDHQTRGRVVFGVGPGLLASDAAMLGIKTTDTRERMEESLAVLLRLLDGEQVTERTSWYDLHNARSQLRPFTRPRPRISVATVGTPMGSRLAGEHDFDIMAFTIPSLLDKLRGEYWNIASEAATRHGRTMDRDRLRIVGPVHIAESREKAFQDIRAGIRRFLDYVHLSMRMPVPDSDDPAELVEALSQAMLSAVGTPEDVIAYIERIEERCGGFGTFLILSHEWADWESTKRSYELFARYVRPHFTGVNRGRWASMRDYDNHAAELAERVRVGTERENAKYMARQSRGGQ